MAKLSVECHKFSLPMFSTKLPATLFKTQFSILCRQNINLFHALCMLSQIDLQ